MTDNQPKTVNLFTEYMTLTAQAVANSSRYYREFLPTSSLLQEDLNWTLAYYKKNTATDLYQKVYCRMDKFGSSSFGGPLFLKLLLDQVTTTGEVNL